MQELPDPRDGEPLSLEQKEIEFTLWPTRRTADGYELTFRIYVTDPWPFLEYYVRSSSPKDNKGGQDAVHFLRQAEDYYRAATSASIRAAKPVLMYYSFLNLVKSAVLCRGPIKDFEGKDRHGLTVRSAPKMNLEEQILTAFPTGYVPNRGHIISMFDELLAFLGAARLSSKSKNEYQLSHLLPQVLMGHRLWAAGSSASDRFVRVNEPLIMKSRSANSIWLRIMLDKANLERCKLSCEELLDKTQMKEEWHDVRSEDRQYVIIEQRKAESYTSSPIDKLKKLADGIRPYLWQAAVLSPPYRKYYIYAAPKEEQGQVLPQLASIYALAYYLSSVTRYRPSEYRKLVSGEYGPFFLGFLQDYPKQFVYLFASEMMKREVSSGDQI